MKIMITLVDDNQNDIDILMAQLNSYPLKKDINFEVSAFINSLDLDILNPETVLYILDIDMPNLNGFALAKQIQEKNSKAIIIFCSQHTNLVFDSFKINTCYFIRKTNLSEDFVYALDKSLRIINDLYSQYLYNYNNKITLIYYSDILYFEVNHNDLFIQLKNGERLKERKTMKKLLSELSTLQFIQIHYSFLVNCYYVKTIEADKIILANNEELPIAKVHIKEIKKKYLTFLSSR